MKKFITNLVIIIFFLIIISLIILSTAGIETSRFNKLITDKISQTKNIDIKLDKIKFKLDPKKLNLFIETKSPKISYRGVAIPLQNVKAYIDFMSLFKSNPKIKKTSFVLEEIDVSHLNKLSPIIKPSNFKNLLNNRIKEGRLFSEIDIFLNEDNSLENFIAKGEVKDLKAEVFSDFNLLNTNLSFFADKNDILLKNIIGELEDIRISDGDIKINLENGLTLKSNFISKLDLKEEFFNRNVKFLKDYIYLNKIKVLKANLNNNFFIILDNTYKVKDYNYSVKGKIQKNKLELPRSIINQYVTEEIKKIYFSDLEIKSSLSPKKIDFKAVGKYSLNNLDFFNIDLKNDINKNLQNVELNLDFNNSLTLDFLNYRKSNKTIGNLSLNIKKRTNDMDIKTLKYSEGKNSIKINDLIIKKNKLSSFKKISIQTKTNDFLIENRSKILVRGNKFDATNLAKFFNNQREENILEKLSSNIEIDFKNINIPVSENLKNFKLIGEIKKGKFIKITSKGEFGGDNFLDISMKKDKNSDKKFLEIYSDLPQPLLTEYSFFDGLSGGKLLFSSIIENSSSTSILKIENFKVVNAPGVVKLLSLADLGGLADLAEGDGLTFDILEIDMEKNNDFLRLNEILALGPSMSVLMEGYKDKSGLTSLRGTLVPAKTLNKMISKIPVLGDIIIPKEVGEGLFGISFKMKGPKGKIKTTINPIRTLTPRFIQKIIDKKKRLNNFN